MAFIPTTMQSGIQVLWQPVAVNHLSNETIQQLKHQNLILKTQLEEALQGRHPNQMGAHFDQQSTQINRFSLGPSQQFQLSRRPSENACYSPRVQHNHQRIYSHYSPKGRQYFSPNQHLSHQTNEQQPFVNNDAQLRRMMISIGKDGKYFRDKVQEEQQQNLNWNTHSYFTKKNTPDVSLKSTPMRSPLKRSNLLNIQNCYNQNNSGKPTITRLRSPTFIQEKHKPPGNTAKRVQITEPQSISWNEPDFKRILSTKQDSQKQNKESSILYEADRNVERYRKSIKMPTVELSVQCDSELSIERIVRQIKKQKKTFKCDSFLFEIEQALSEMYENKQEQ